jgi:hypothetical protein
MVKGAGLSCGTSLEHPNIAKELKAICPNVTPSLLTQAAPLPTLKTMNPPQD